MKYGRIVLSNDNDDSRCTDCKIYCGMALHGRIMHMTDERVDQVQQEACIPMREPAQFGMDG